MRFLSGMILIMLSLNTTLSAQSEVNFTQFMHNQLAINPAYAGSHEALTFTSLYRHQWQGIEGAPRTFNFNVNSSFFKKRCGIGLSLTSDRIGFYKTLAAELSYAYRLKISEENSLSIGLQGRIERGSIDWQDADPYELIDERIPMAEARRINPNFGLGVHYSSEKFFAGFSIPTILATTHYHESGGTLDYSSMRSTYLLAGIVHRLSKNVYFRPSVLATFNKSAPFDLDLNASFLLMEKVWLGVSYRLDDSVDVIFQYQINQQIKAGIATDFAITEVGNHSDGTFEVLLEYTMAYKDKKIDNIRFF